MIPVKSQAVRLVDVFALGPWLMLLGSRGRLTEGERALLVTVGALTIAYNGYYYLQHRAAGE